MVKNKKENVKLNLIIPEFLNVEECVYLLDTFREHREIYKEGIEIFGLSGMFPGCRWSEQDKKFDMYSLSIDMLNGIKNKYNNEYNKSLFILFDKEDISVKDLCDEYSNEVIKIFDDKKNYAICKSKRLIDYLKENYHNINIINYDEPSEKEFGILNPSENRNKKIFENDNKNNFIIIPDGGFIPNRRNLFHHSKKDSVLFKINPKKDKYYSPKNSLSFIEAKEQEEYLTYEDMIEYAKKGINTFMFSGMGVYNIAMYENYIDYIYTDEYKMDASNNMLTKLIKLKEQECNAIYKYEL